MDLQHWINTPTVSIDFKENHGTHLLSCKDGKQAQFRLMPKYIENCHGEETICQFYLTYEHGRMQPNWEELLFTPLGQEDVPPLPTPLPPWSPEKDPEYSKALNPIITELYKSDTRLNRLEAMLPLYLDHSPVSKRSLTIDRVRMVYLENAVKAANPNLVLVVFSYLDGYKVAQNGAGSGPPRKA